MKFYFGSDPEFMLQSNIGLKSAIGILPEKKFAKSKHGNKFYYDNVLAEIAIQPAESREQVVENTRNALNDLAKLIKPNKFIIQAAADYPDKELIGEKAEIAGCNPEWDIYTFNIIEPPENMVIFKETHYHFKVPFRSAGGHIHIGSEALPTDELMCNNIIRMMDLFIGVPSIFLDQDETSKTRRLAYGLAGSHRNPPHGIEYRTLSNFWFSSPKLVELIYDLTDFVVDFVTSNLHTKFWSLDEELIFKDPELACDCFGYDLKALKKCINQCDKKQAEKFMLFINNYLPTHITNTIENLSKKPLANPYTEWELNV